MKIIGHRGAKALAPENTLASFQKALDIGVDEIECDVHITKDGVVVLVHDPQMHDAAGESYDVATHTYQQLLKYKPDLTTLSEALELVNRKVPVMVEIKPGVAVEPVLACFKKLYARGWKTDDISIASESYSILKTARQAMPDVELSFVENWSGLRATIVARRLGITRLSMNYRVLWSGFVRPMTKRGYRISAYTVNNQDSAKRLEHAGLHGIFTDKPDLLR